MTPDEARALLDGTTPGPWKLRWDTWELSVFDVEEEPVAIDLAVRDSDLIAAAPALAAMIAGMHEEWGVHVTGYPKNIADWAAICDDPADSIEWFADEEAAEEFATEREDEGFDTRIVRRYVTDEEEA